MSEQQVKMNNWPFKKGEQVQLIWISSPFRHEKKIMIYAYFRASGKTEKLLMDWGTLPALAIQHYYIDSNIRKSIPPRGTEEVEITIEPNKTDEYEKEWSIQGTNDKDISRSFIVKQGDKSYIIPLIEVVRSILAPNRFLLYRLFETNSFPQYFLERYERDKIHLDFSSQYHRKYTQTTFLYQLVWVLSNQDLRNIFENMAYIFINTGILKFDWLFRQPITIKSVVKPTSNGGTVLRVVSVKNKHIPYSEISYSHPGIVQTEKSGEAKKYTLHSKKNVGIQQEELVIDEEAEGTTDNFDIIEMDNQKHEYVNLPKVTKVLKYSSKKREFEDEHTKRRFFEDQGKRSTADDGGGNLARGIEVLALTDIHVYGELGDFIKVIKVLDNYNEVQAINIIQGSLKEFYDTKSFVYLSDSMTERKYVIAEIRLFSSKEISVIEVEREDKALSTLISFISSQQDRGKYYRQILNGLINNQGAWDKKQLQINNIDFSTLRHGKRDFEHRAKNLFNKF